jgi:3-phenylpropionate/trans-cinnamate dioxygenase ferredoxin subunit
VCAAADVAKGEVVSVDLDGTPIALVHADDDRFYAVYDECSHAAVALSEGEVDGCTLECWLHGSRFDLRTGEPTGLPATEPCRSTPSRSATAKSLFLSSQATESTHHHEHARDPRPEGVGQASRR